MGDPLQERAPDETPEQVSSINQLAAFCLWPLGLCSIVLYGALADHVTPLWFFWSRALSKSYPISIYLSRCPGRQRSLHPSGALRRCS